jgi:hypothetical protein
MAKGKSGGSKSGKSYTSAQAHQKTGQSIGGYTKVKSGDGGFRMKKTGK